MNPCCSGSGGTHGSLLLENPRGDFLLSKDELNRQVRSIF